jgi:hypothetical protein
VNADLRCVECEPHDGERFRAYLTVDDEVAVYCPECAEREFGGKGERAPVDVDNEDLSAPRRRALP